MATWRINLKTQPNANVRQYCLTKNIVGFGWKVDYEVNPVTAENYYKKGAEVYGNNGHKGGWRKAWNAFYNKMKIGDLIWTRDTDGIYYLGRIAGDWFYDTTEEAASFNVVNTRACDWQKIGTVESVPGKIVSCFIPPSTIQQVNDRSVDLFSQLIYNEKSSFKIYTPDNLNNEDLYTLLSSDDCEDALALYLQVKKNYVLIPSSCKSDTLGYEYELVNLETKEKAVAQVKTGHSSLNRDVYKNIEETVFLFATNGSYTGNEHENIFCIDPKEIKDFLYDFEEILPKKMSYWIQLTKSKN